MGALIDRQAQQGRREDYRFAVLDCIVANMLRDSKHRALTPEDFMPGPRKRRRQTPQQMYELVKIMAQELGGNFDA